MIREKAIDTVLLDFEGTIFIQNDLIPGAAETIQWLFDHNYKVRFVTNTTVLNRRQMRDRLKRVISADIPIEHFFTPARVALHWFQMREMTHGIFPLVHSNLLEDLKGLPLTDKAPANFVLVGDMGNEWDIKQMNRALHCLLSGATLTTLLKNRFWNSYLDGVKLDAGAFVAALEYGADTSCRKVFGKPEEVFFSMALHDAESKPETSVMVGDDLEFDVKGAEYAGIEGVLVKTGKFRPEILLREDTSDIEIIESIADLPKLLMSKQEGF
ncbi:MAG: HAD hydrolase-like protein [Verrucomicrobiota bacterium]|nr:HAD hydrolase-like protein [Verrucomicrobiota bacterium]